jgi:hypothetical protein
MLGFFHQQRDGTYTGRPETFLDPFSLYLGREIQEHIQNILFLAEAV